MSYAAIAFLAFLLWLLLYGYDWIAGWLYTGCHRRETRCSKGLGWPLSGPGRRPVT